jgi:hypothetical protein
LALNCKTSTNVLVGQVFVSPTNPDKIFSFNPAHQSYSVARASCQAQGGDIANVLTSGETNVIISRFPSLTLWIGINDKDTEGTYVWESGAVSAYSNWQSGEPNNGGYGQQDCAALVVDAGGTWDDIECTSSFLSLCTKCNGTACNQVVPSLCSRSNANLHTESMYASCSFQFETDN